MAGEIDIHAPNGTTPKTTRFPPPTRRRQRKKKRREEAARSTDSMQHKDMFPFICWPLSSYGICIDGTRGEEAQQVQQTMCSIRS